MSAREAKRLGASKRQKREMLGKQADVRQGMRMWLCNGEDNSG